MNSKRYDQLKALALIGLPALATLYFTVANLWGLPAADQVVGTITAIDGALGLYIKYLSAQYEKKPEQYAGDLVVTQDPYTKQREVYLAMSHDGDAMLGSTDKVILKVIQK